MERAFKYLGSAEQMKHLWQNKEALEKYIARLKDFWDEENQCWLEKPQKVMEDIHNQRPSPMTTSSLGHGLMVYFSGLALLGVEWILKQGIG